MTPETITQQLEGILAAPNPVHACYQLVEQWNAASIVPDQVTNPILHLMEEHTDVDFGLPGPLVRFMESGIGAAWYQDALVRSIERKPVPYAVWMLERLIKVTPDPAGRTRLIATLRAAKNNPNASADLVEDIDRALAELDAAQA